MTGFVVFLKEYIYIYIYTYNIYIYIYTDFPSSIIFVKQSLPRKSGQKCLLLTFTEAQTKPILRIILGLPKNINLKPTRHTHLIAY